jgi:hypothetical protein
MSHAVSRLESRASYDAAARGFRLLRDAHALRRFLALRAQADAAFDVDCIALALEAGAKPSHLLVSREGDGVTCLAAGMVVSAPVVSYPLVQDFLAEQDKLLRAKKAVLAAKDADRHHSPLVRLVENPHRLVREDVLALRSVLPLMGVTHHRAAVEAAISEVIDVLSGQRTTRQALEASWRIFQGGVAGLVIAGGEPDMFGAALAATATGEPRLGSVALWQLVHHPQGTLARALQMVEVDNAAAHDVLLDTILPAIALRFVGLERDAGAVARVLQEKRGLPVVGLPPGDVLYLDFLRQLVLVLPLVLGPMCPQDVMAALGDDGARLTERLRAATRSSDVVALAPPWVAETLRLWNLTLRRHDPPRTAARRPESLTEQERAALLLWRSLFLTPALPVRGTGQLFAFLVAHAPVEAILPADAPEPASAMSQGVSWLSRDLPVLLGIPERSSLAKMAHPRARKPLPARGKKARHRR